MNTPQKRSKYNLFLISFLLVLMTEAVAIFDKNLKRQAAVAGMATFAPMYNFVAIYLNKSLLVSHL